MAGDWIKMRTNLRTSPKVARIASALKADRLRVIGGLHAVWCLFDEHSADGVLDGYTMETLDDELRWPGFAAAMVAVEWLEDGGDFLSTPRFDEHNGQSAKRRCQEAERKRNERKTSSSASASKADKGVTREEKRREEKEEKHKTSSAAAPAAAVVERRADRLEAIEQELAGEVAEAQAARQAEIEMEAPAFTLPLNTGDEYPIMAAQVAEFSSLYPAVDVMQELKKMRGWLLGSPDRRKTRKGVMRFVTGWLAKQQDEGAARRPNGIAPNRATGRTSINAPFQPGADDDIFNQLRRN